MEALVKNKSFLALKQNERSQRVPLPSFAQFLHYISILENRWCKWPNKNSQHRVGEQKIQGVNSFEACAEKCDNDSNCREILSPFSCIIHLHQSNLKLYCIIFTYFRAAVKRGLNSKSI